MTGPLLPQTQEKNKKGRKKHKDNPQQYIYDIKCVFKSDIYPPP